MTANMAAPLNTLKQIAVIFALIASSSNNIVCGLVNLNVKPPVFGIAKWLEADDYQWKDYGEADAGLQYNSTTYIIPGEISALILECNASFPVEIQFEMDEIFALSDFLLLAGVMTKARREASSVFDKTSHQYSMKFMFYSVSNQNTGYYVCRNTLSPEVETRIYIMWEGNSPPYLLGAQRTITVSAAKKELVILPCKVSADQVDVFLDKQMNVTHEDNKTTIEFVPLTLNESIIFDSSYGFSLNVTQMQDVTGFYRCSTLEVGDELYINVTLEAPKKDERFVPTTRGSEVATLSYQADDYSLVCCSNSAKPPSLFYIPCPTPTLCKLIRKLGTRITQILSRYPYGGTTPKKNCTKQSIRSYSGVAICKGDGIDTSLEVFFPVETTANGTRLDEIYKKWSDAKPENLLRIRTLTLSKLSYKDPYGQTIYYSRETPWNAGTPIYSGQNVSFKCETSPYYFATGVKWKIEWANKTVEWPEFSDIEDINTYIYYWINSKPITVLMHKEMSSITCYAPVWNSTDWIEKKFSLQVEDPIQPVISTSSPDIIYWTLNDTDKHIECATTEGKPAPRMYWLKDGKELPPDQTADFSVNSSESGILTIDFKIVSYDTHGVYTCVSSNLAGSTQRMFTVIVEESHPWIAIIVIIVVSTGLILGIGFLVYKIKSQRNMADALKRTTEFQRSRDLD